MENKKIFVYDTLCLGFPDSITYLKDQKFLFGAKTNKNYMMFYSGNVYLVKAPYGHECFGELFEVHPLVFEKINKRFSKMGFTLNQIIVYETDTGKEHQVDTWLYTIEDLRRKNFKVITLRCFRDMSPSLSGNVGLPKTCC